MFWLLVLINFTDLGRPSTVQSIPADEVVHTTPMIDWDAWKGGDRNPYQYNDRP